MKVYGMARNTLELAALTQEVLEALGTKHGQLNRLIIEHIPSSQKLVAVALLESGWLKVDAWGRYELTNHAAEILDAGTVNQLRGNTTLA